MFLILTPLKEFWKRDTELLALGTWCDPHNRRNNSSNQVLVYGKTLDTLEEAIEPPSKVYDDVLDELSNA